MDEWQSMERCEYSEADRLEVHWKSFLRPVCVR